MRRVGGFVPSFSTRVGSEPAATVGRLVMGDSGCPGRGGASTIAMLLSARRYRPRVRTLRARVPHDTHTPALHSRRSTQAPSGAA